MNVLWKVTWRSLKENRMRTVVTVIGIILSAAMICAVTSFAASIRNYMVQITVYTTGDWHASALDAPVDTLVQLREDDAVESLVYARQLGYAYAEGGQNEYKPYLFVLEANESFLTTMPVHLTRGRFPQTGEEILLPDHLAENGGVIYDLGAELELSLGRRELEGVPLGQHTPAYRYEQGDEVLNDEVLIPEQTCRYRVVGFYERPDFEEHTAPGYTCITYGAGTVTMGSYDVYFKLTDMGKTFAYLQEKGISGTVNTGLLTYSGESGYPGFYTVLYSLCGIVIGLILFGAVSLIYNAFSISVSERTRQFGLLSSVGATKKQLRHMVFCEALIVGAIGIPLGVSAGILGIGVTLLIIGHRFTVFGSYPIPLRLHVSWLSVGVAFLVALATVLISAWIPSRSAARMSPIAAIRQQKDVKVGRKRERSYAITLRLFGIPGVLAKKHFRRNAKRYRATVLSLFMSIVLFVSASSFTDTLQGVAGVGLATENYDLSVHLSLDELGHRTPEEVLMQLKEAEGVTDAAFTRSAEFVASVPEDVLTKQALRYRSALQTSRIWGREGEIELRCVVMFVDEASFTQLLRRNGLPAEDYTDPEAPRAVLLDGITLYDPDQQKYHSVDLLQRDGFSLSVAKEKQLDGYYCVGPVVDDQGAVVIRYYASEYPNSAMDLPLEEGYDYRQLQTGAAVKEKPLFTRRISGLACVYPISAADRVLQGIPYNTGTVAFSFSSADHKKTEASLKQILARQGLNTSVYNYAEQVEDERNMLLIIYVFAYGFIVLISLVAAANVFHTISTNIALRRREFGVLTSVGMSRRGFRAMLNYECLLYGFRALAWGIPISGLVALLIQYSVYSGVTRAITVPWGAMLIAAVSVFCVVFASMLYAMGKAEKDNPIDDLRNENL